MTSFFSQHNKSKHRGLKNLIRGTRRLLAKNFINSELRVTQEQKLCKFDAKQKQLETRDRERKNAIQYHKIKFFERLKIRRHICQLRKSFNIDLIKLKEKQALQQAFEDHQYVLNFP